MKSFIPKILGVPIFVIFINIGFILFAGEVYTYLPTLTPIFLINLIISLDIVIRPISPREDEYKRWILMISFLLLPIILFLPYYEYKLILQYVLTPFLYYWTVISGTLLLFCGGLILLTSRIQLGKYGGPRIVIETNHKLITNGIYRFIRHPMYLGFLIIFFGYSLALGSIFMTTLISFTFLLIFKGRIELEERILISEFGDEYMKYMERTKKLLPFLY